MARPREFDEQQALDAAMQVFWEKGYEATSMGDLTSRMGIQRPSLYAAFGGKQELFVAALNRYVEMNLRYVESLLRSAPTVREGISRFLLGIASDSADAHPERGCLCVNTMVELAPHEPVLAERTRDYQRRLAGLLERALADAIGRGELPAGLYAAGVAHAIMIAAIGLSVSMKTGPDRDWVENAAAQILQLLG